MQSRIKDWAVSVRIPLGSPDGSRRICPPEGTGVDVSMPAIASAVELTQSEWPSLELNAAGVLGNMRSRLCRVGCMGMGQML